MSIQRRGGATHASTGRPLYVQERPRNDGPSWHNPRVLSFPLVLACLVCPPAQAGAAPKDLAAARVVIRGLSDDLAFEFAEQLRMESSWRKDFRTSLQTYLLKNPSQDPATFPLVDAAPMYDPREHCPRQPIARKRLPSDGARAKRALERFHPSNSAQDIEPGWVYDYAARTLRRTAHWRSPHRLLRNALLGAPPDQDLAIANLELHLDSGELTESFRAFSHAYADRSGTVFPGVTLYDAWASGAKMEMPDVECLGIIHDLRDDWKTWRAPVRAQDSLYEAISDLFFPLRQHRGLRHALALSYMVGDKEALGEYGSNHAQLHALWESCSSTPPKLLPRLPAAKQWRGFLETWSEQVAATEGLHDKARRRADALRSSAIQTQALVLRILRENELLPN